MRADILGAYILVTGGAGFIGSHLVDKLLSKGAKKVIIVDNLFVGRVENLQSAIKKGAVIVRPFNNYGPHQNYEGVLAGIIPVTVKRIMQGIAPEMHGTGEQSRDFIFVHDTVNAVMKLYEKMKIGESVNISTNSQIKIKKLIEKIVEQMKFNGEIVYKERRNADVDCHNASNAKLLEMIDFKPTKFDDRLIQTIEWYKENIVL